MSESFFPRLCGGTFFTLITHAMKQHGRSRDSVQGISSNITEAECFKALVRVYYPALPNLAKSTEKSNASNYKKCKNLSDGLIPFSDRFINIGFSRIIGNDYRLLLSRMDDFVRRFIDVEYYGEWLVRALIQLILEDQTIEDDVLFQIFPDGSGVTKEELLSVHTVYIQSFLLGVWSYIVHMVPDNSVGCETFLLWHPSAREGGNGSRHRFVGNIGSKVSWPLSVSLCEVQRKTTVASIVDQSDQKLSQKYAGYLTVARRKYETIKTIMDEAPKKFYDFYVCNGLGLKRLRDPIPDPTVDSICAVSPYAIIVGTGGLGKSMMMRHLMLNTIDRVDFICKLPVFVNLKDYNRENLELTDFFFEQFRLLNPDADKSVFTAGLSDGAYVLLLDGLDEVNSEYRNQFDRMLSDFVDSCGGNIVIISSRPLGDFTRFEKFYEMNLLPFSKSKALQLVDRLVFHPEEPEFKKKFRDQLDKKLFYTHHEFAVNPLLLTFMLMTFERFGEVATEMHAFYGEVYDLLSKRHDAQKVGFTRAYKSGLKPDRLKDIFAAFCATTYADQRYTFSSDDMVDYLSKILIRLRDESERKIPPEDIIQDLTSAVCMAACYLAAACAGGKYVQVSQDLWDEIAVFLLDADKEISYTSLSQFFFGKELSRNFNIGFGNWDLISAAYYFNLSRKSPCSGEFPIAYDYKENTLHLNQKATYKEGLLAAVRLYDIANADSFSAEDDANAFRAVFPETLLKKANGMPAVSPEDHPYWTGFAFLWEQASKDASEKAIYDTARWGFNCVRLYVDYRLIFQNGDYRTPNYSGLRILDRFIAVAMENQIHLDMCVSHLPGHALGDGVFNVARDMDLFKNKKKQEQVDEIWRFLTRRYQQIPNSCLSFSPIFEPSMGVSDVSYGIKEIANYTSHLIHVIREEDPDRLIIYEATGVTIDTDDSPERVRKAIKDKDNLILIRNYEPHPVK